MITIIDSDYLSYYSFYNIILFMKFTVGIDRSKSVKWIYSVLNLIIGILIQ